MVLICISLISDTEHLFMYLMLFICLVWQNVDSVPLRIFQLDLKIFFICMLWSCMSFLSILGINPWYIICKCLLRSYRFSWFLLLMEKSFNLICPIVYFCFSFFCILCHFQKIVSKTSVRELFHSFSSRCFMVSGLVFKSFNSFQVNFCELCRESSFIP